MKLGTEKIEAILENVKVLVIAGKEIKKDEKVDFADLPTVVALLPKLPSMIENFKTIGEALEEGKDIDVAEIVALIQKVHALVKEIEKA